MSLYLKVPNMSGNVQAEGYQGWIELSAMSFGASRDVSRNIGKSNDRNNSYPQIQQLELIKAIDKSSNNFLENVLAGKSLGTIQIHMCRTDKSLSPFMKYELSNAMVSNYQEISSEDGMGQEQLILSFTKLQRSYIAHNSMGQEQSPQIMGYDLEAAQLT